MPRIQTFALALALAVLPAALARAEPLLVAPVEGAVAAPAPDREAPPGDAALNAAPVEIAPPPASPPAPAIGTAPPDTPFMAALREKIAKLPSEGTDEELRERAAIHAFYEARTFAPLWTTSAGLAPNAAAAIAEIQNANDWGLDAGDFSLPAPGMAASDPAALAEAELTLSIAVQKYARFARGGRIIHPAGQLNSNLDRRPQFLDPKTVIDGAASAPDAGAYLRSVHPPHPQFERLRQKYLAARAGDRSVDAKKMLANMEQWRWMWTDLGALHMIANVPEFMIHVVKNGTTVHSERIVAGEIGKQTAIFSRRLKHVVLRPRWRVPESIKVYELQPSLRRGGGMFYKYGLQLETKDGKPLDFRTIDWTTADIRDYEVTQPPGPKSVLGFVKFSFPSQHTIYMHDTPDKYMFNAKQRTLSHGCLRVRNPKKLVELLLGEDKGWDSVAIDALVRNGPLDNAVAIEGKIPIHITYFTAWVEDDGTLKTYRDIYGHEQRIKLALEGKWDKIVKGRDHLAPVDPKRAPPSKVARARKKKDEGGFGDLLGGFFGGGF